MADVYKKAGRTVARLDELQGHLQSAAEGVLAKAKAEASKSRDTGDYMNSLTIEKDKTKYGVVDRLVVADDPAAVHIEYGTVRGEKFIPGKYIMTKAANS